MDNTLQQLQGGRVLEDDPAQPTAIDLAVGKFQVFTKRIQDGAPGWPSWKVGLLGEKVRIQAKRASVFEVLAHHAFTRGDITCQTEHERFIPHGLSIHQVDRFPRQVSECYNFSMLPDMILTSLAEDCKFDPQSPLLVGVSGGADSLCLAHVLKQAGVNFTAAHLDHGLRPESAQQARQLESRLQAWGVAVISGSKDVRGYAREQKIGIEEAARICRYQFLFEQARKLQAQAVVVAHQADDQVETVLMHFLRGSGVNGLAGMSPVSFLAQFDLALPLFRPMLGTFRRQIDAYCKEHDISPLEDESNRDERYFRNRLRNELIPYLETYSPALKTVTLRSSLSLRSDRDLLAAFQEEAYRQCLLPDDQDWRVLLDRQLFLSLREGLQRRVLIAAAHALEPGLRDLGYEQVERARAAILGGQLRSDLRAGIQVWVIDQVIQLTRGTRAPLVTGFPQLSQGSRERLTRRGTLALANGWQLSARLVDSREFNQLPHSQKTHANHAWINPLDIEWPLEVRGMKTGERWSPLGMGLDHQKLSDFFTNNKIPRPARAGWPLVVSGGSIVWVVGLRIAQPWRLTGDEPEILHLELSRAG